MLSVARTKRTSEQIRAEIEQTFGFFPPFYEPALASPQVLESLWQQALSAYIDNPLSALFKEKLNALLSRFCTAPYCIIVHSCALRPLGMTAQQVLALLEAPPSGLEAPLPLGALPIPASEEAASPALDSPLEAVLLYCTTAVFLERADAPTCQAELRRLLGPDLYPALVAYLAYIKTCHTWIECHPDISYEADQRAVENLGSLLAEEPALAEFFRHYQERAREQGLGRERRRATDERLRTEQARTAVILESITDAFFSLSSDWRFTYLNDQAEKMLQRPRAKLLGKIIWEEFPAAVGTDFDRQYHLAEAEQTAVTFEAYYPPPLGSWFEVRAYPSPDGLSIYFHNINERVAREKRERFLADLAERSRTLTDPDEVITDAVNSVGEFLGVSRCLFADINIEADTCSVPPHYRADDSVASIAGAFPISAFGPFVVAEYKAGRTAVVDDVCADEVKAPPESLAAYEAIGVGAYVAAPVLHSDRLVSALAVHSAEPRHWTPEEVDLVQAIVERTWLTVEVLRQQRALAREAETTARILASITDAFFTLDRAWRFVRINAQAERLMTRPHEEIMGLVFWDAFPSLVGTQFEREYRHAVNENVAVTFEIFYAPLNAWLDVRAFPFEDGLSVFFQNITERKRAEAERERLLEEEQKHSKREALLNRIGQAIRSTLDPDLIQQRAATFLGEALSTDRCFYVTYDLFRDRARVSEDWHRDALPSLAGEYRASDFGLLLSELFPMPQTAVVEDVRVAFSPAVASAFEASRHRAVLVVPFFDEGALVAALYLSQADAPRVWTAEETALAEQVATLTRTALEAARVQAREHAIAEQLQDALQPALPDHIQGLSIGRFTKPALDEAQIGGDFYDIFPLDKNLYAILIGDVSGKGLAAAQQLALIRNSLRTVLYLYHSPARAAATLNGIVMAHDLLVGFVTAFIAVYDSAMGQIIYCSCGHEPGLLRRAGGGLEMLETTGPPLGVAENATYSEASIAFLSGDRLLLYTDGISEAGPSRREMLGTEGLMRLFAMLPVRLEAQPEVETLVAEVGEFTGGIFRDDVAVLLMRRE